MSELCSLDFQVTVASYLRGAQVCCEAVVGKIVVSPYALVMLKPSNIIHLWSRVLGSEFQLHSLPFLGCC